MATKYEIHQTDSARVGRVSNYISDNFSPNPFYGKVEALLDHTLELDGMLQYLEDMEDENGELDEDAAAEALLAQFGGEIDGLMDTWESTEETRPVHPITPAPSDLYTRVVDVPILDIGSGDCNKLSKCQSPYKRPSDLNIVENTHGMLVRKLDATLSDDIMSGLPEEGIVTSFNVYTQLADTAAIQEFDGLHIFPDMEYAEKHLACTLDGEKLITKGKHGAHFEDYKSNVAGDVHSAGFLCANFYAERKVTFEYDKPKKFAPYVAQMNDVDYMLKVDKTRKYDGVNMMLFSSESGTSLKMRNGYGYTLKGENINSIIQVEKLPKEGPAECFVIIRVIKYKKYYPFHGANNLMTFANKVRIKIGGKCLYGPKDPRLMKYDYDGYIFRIAGLDYRYKQEQTVDILDTDAYRDKMLKKGYVLEFEEYEHSNMIKEFIIREVSSVDVAKLRFRCVRPDKDSETTVERTALLIDQW